MCIFPYLNATEICSGTLIGPNLVLTARHCVAQELGVEGGVLCSKSTFGDAYPVDNFVVTPAKDVFEGGPWFFAREADVTGKPGDLECGNDLAVLHLRQSYVGAPPASVRVAAPAVKNEIYSAVGYGDNLAGGLGYRHRRDGLKVACVGSECKLLGSDFAPLAEPTELMGQTGLCGGDSGGPALDASGVILGVTSRGAPGCTFPVYSRVDSHAAWLQAQAVQAASEGNYPIPAWAYATLPSDAGGDGGAGDAAPPAIDASPAPTVSPETPGRALGGCGIGARGAPRGAEFALVLLGLLRFVRRGSKSTS